MKKCSLIILSGFILLTLCGCDNTSITGKYKQTEFDGSLTLYEDGKCHWRYGYYYTNYHYNYSRPDIIDYERDECSYSYVNDEISITTHLIYYSNTITCSYNNGVIDCGEDGIYEKQKD